MKMVIAAGLQNFVTAWLNRYSAPERFCQAVLQFVSGSKHPSS
jgi:hypothetical protein